MNDDRQLRGRYSECRVVDLVLRLGEPWIFGARLATKDEDRRGIDVVVATDVGGLPLQVKSSEKGANVWRRKNVALGNRHRNVMIALVVAGDRADISVERDLRAELARVREVMAVGDLVAI